MAGATKASAPSLFSGMGASAAAHRERMQELRESRREATERAPSAATMKRDAAALRNAIKREQVREIASRANPKSRDTEDVFTASGRRYARTDLYKPTISDRAKALRNKASAKGSRFWEKNKTTILIGAVAALGAYVVYTAMTKEAAPVARAPLPTRPPHPTAARIPVTPHRHVAGAMPWSVPQGPMCPIGMTFDFNLGQCVPLMR